MKQVSSHYEKRLKEHSGVVSLHPPSTLMNDTNPPLAWIVPLAALIAAVFAAYLFLAVVPQRTRGSGRR